MGKVKDEVIKKAGETAPARKPMIVRAPLSREDVEFAERFNRCVRSGLIRFK